MNFYKCINRIFIVGLIAPVLLLLGSGCQTDQIQQPIVPIKEVLSQQTGAQGTQREVISLAEQESSKDLLQRYFNLIDLKKYEDAYDLTSEAFRAKHPFEKWRDGYKNTLSHSVDSVSCLELSCVIDLVAAEDDENALIKQRYSIRYGVVRDKYSRLVIDTGSLISTKLIETVRSYEAVTESAPTTNIESPALVPIPAPTSKAVVPSNPAPNGTYTNTYGNEVPSPYYAPSAPAGASARCRDGTYSFSQSRRGTCSHHGGVEEWL